MLNPIVGTPAIVATDLAGKVIWTYNPPDNRGFTMVCAEAIADGDFILGECRLFHCPSYRGASRCS